MHKPLELMSLYRRVEVGEFIRCAESGRLCWHVYGSGATRADAIAKAERKCPAELAGRTVPHAPTVTHEAWLSGFAGGAG